MYNPHVSLLPDNPSAQFTAVQGGGSRSPQWISSPVTMKSNYQNDLRSTPTQLKKFHSLWKRKLGPSVPSRHKPKADPVFIIGSLNEKEVNGFVVAPLRGDRDAAQTLLNWSSEQIQKQSNSYILFHQPLTTGGGKENGEWIHTQLETLSAIYPGHILIVGQRESTTPSTLPCLDGVFFYSLPETETQIAFGYLPDPRLVYERHSQSIDLLDIDVLKTADAGRKQADESEEILTMRFMKSSAPFSFEKEQRVQVIRTNHQWSAPPGWVTRISLDGSKSQMGGVDVPAVPVVPNTVKVYLGDTGYEIRSPTEEVKKLWEQQQFSPDEEKLLQDQELRYDPKVYGLFLEGLTLADCNTEASTFLNPACGVYRYIMADRLYQKLKVANRGMATIRTDISGVVPSAPPTNVSTSTDIPSKGLPPSPGPTPPVPPSPGATGPTPTSPGATGPTPPVPPSPGATGPVPPSPGPPSPPGDPNPPSPNSKTKKKKGTGFQPKPTPTPKSTSGMVTRSKKGGTRRRTR